jgi:hypothetical protein
VNDGHNSWPIQQRPSRLIGSTYSEGPKHGHRGFTTRPKQTASRPSPRRLSDPGSATATIEFTRNCTRFCRSGPPLTKSSTPSLDKKRLRSIGARGSVSRSESTWPVRLGRAPVL